MENFARILTIAAAAAVLTLPAFADRKAVQPGPGAPGTWRLVGRTQADHSADRDAIVVKGPYDNSRKVKFKVTDAALNLHRWW